ncbi:hypothetical protein PROFUN_11293 [Planoprotostelium fungivorum]|uniref:Uncharacterized protein n=1 Tax=Planoprotostelium fungivorum TaxID=1890364 RepID=A0A2P6N2I9_9EUKA|nr:hypothetical protein PROFUN_11293 [Planoprotostelium fungivorum]
MKRQRTQMITREEETAFQILKADDRATVVICCSEEAHRITMSNDAACELLSDILVDESTQPEFWTTVDRVGTMGGTSEATLRTSDQIIDTKLRMVQLSDKRYVVVTAKRAKRNAPAQPTSFYNAILTDDVLPLSSPVSIPFSPCSSSSLSPPLSPCVDRSWTKRQWEIFVEDLILYAKGHPRCTSRERQRLPEKFLADTNSVYCYVYRGAFLPSGMSDGFKWKSSCNVPSQGKLQKRYFYTTTPQGEKLRRRVMWSDEAPGMCAIEYRHCSHCGNTESEKLMSPKDIDWTEIMDHICEKGNQRLLQTMEELSAQFESTARRDPPPAAEEPAHVLSYVNGILDNWAIQYHSNDHLLDI